MAELGGPTVGFIGNLVAYHLKGQIKASFVYSLKNIQVINFSFQEFSKEVEGKSSLKSSVVSEGNQLLRLKKVDTVALRSDLARIDSQWAELLTRIPVVQEKLHQVTSHVANT